MSVRVQGRWYPIEIPSSDGDLAPTTRTFHLDTDSYTAQDPLRSTIIANNMYFSNYNDEIMKFDGTNIYRAGLPKWQPALFASLDTGTTAISVISSAIAAVDGSRFTVNAGQAALFEAGQTVYHTNDAKFYTVDTVDVDNSYVTVTTAITGAAADDLNIVKNYRYYFRLNMIDANSNIIASATTSGEDFRVQLNVSSQIKLKLVGMPTLDLYDYDRIEVEIYRTKASLENPFYRIATLPVDFDNDAGYILFTDGIGDDTLTAGDLDAPVTAQKGVELAPNWSQGMRAKYVTSSANRLVLGNIKGYPELDITIRKLATDTLLTSTELLAAGEVTWLFRKDNTDTGTVTNMIDRATYEFVDTSNEVNLLNTDVPVVFVDGDVTVGTDNINKAHGFLDGDRVQLTSSDTLPAGLALATDYWIIFIDAANFKLASSITNAVADTAVDITAAAGGGNHTVTAYANMTESSTDVLEISSIAHGLAIGDWIYMYHASEGTNNDLTFAGWYQINSVGTDWFRINTLDARAGTANDCDRYTVATVTTDIPVLVETDGNLNLKNANATDRSFGPQAMLRLANAINSTMRMTDKTVTAMATFKPWMIANSGQEYGKGRLVIRQPVSTSTTLELALDSAHNTSYKVFVNNIEREASEQISASTDLFSSRIIVSYENYPEIFDNPLGDTGTLLDINRADGQEITGIIPFFAESAFGQGQKGGIVVVFKSKSIYIVDINQSTLTGDSVQKIDSQGLGCIFPYSIAPTRNGVMFANRSGIYKLNYDLTISYAGKNTEDYWLKTVNRDQTTTVMGHHYALERRYELSVPVDSAETNSAMLVYDHTREGQGQPNGAWTRYTNFASTGWTNLANDAFFSTTGGRVFSIRRLGDTTDFRDDSSAVAEMEILTKPFAMGTSGVRHKLRSIISHFEINGNMTGTELKTAVNLSNNFTSAGTFSITDTDSSSQFLDRQVVSLRASVAVQKFIYVQLKYLNSTKDEDVVLSGIDFTAAALSSKGIQQVGYNSGSITS